ncbi:MAG: hypothetical protein Q7U54_18430 [Bacteroidales bacterium]|nr:hypothetical protein [Bacteroidales bacterium]
MINWLINNPWVFGLITFVLMQFDWFLTLSQEKERKEHYFRHYQSYPVNTIEGNPAFQKSVSKSQYLNPKHLIASVIMGAAVTYALIVIPTGFHALFIGYVWGLFLIVCTQHLTNLTGYIASRKGLHGKLFLHQRTGYLIQSGRYLSISLLLLVLSILSGSEIIYGVTIAGFTSSIRHLLLLRKVPKIEQEDLPPDLK